jgi:F-type H+-transporting ATPase subunit epsilon
MISEPTSIELQVVTPEKQVISATVTEIQLPGLAGYLGILPGHAPLLTELGIGVLSYVAEGVSYYAAVSGGFAEVLPGRVIVLADMAEAAVDIDAGRAQAALERAQKLLSNQSPETDWDQAAAALERAMVRLQVAAKEGTVTTTQAN